MKIPDDVLNSNIEYCIDEYVREVEHRDILRERWFYGCTLEQLAGKYHKSVTAIKSIVYDTGDKILIRAANMKKPDQEMWLIRNTLKSFFPFFNTHKKQSEM